jgi:hypothetical protein
MSELQISINFPLWYTKHIANLRTIDHAEFLELISDPPLGRSEFFMPFSDISRGTGFKRSGAAGWTYFPPDDNGQLARASFSSKTHAFYLTAVVNLTRRRDTEDEEIFQASEFGLVTLDNLTPHGKSKRKSGKKITILY